MFSCNIKLLNCIKSKYLDLQSELQYVVKLFIHFVFVSRIQFFNIDNTYILNFFLKIKCKKLKLCTKRPSDEVLLAIFEEGIINNVKISNICRM